MSIRERKIEKLIKSVKAQKLKRQFHTFIAWGVLMALITSHGMNSSFLVIKLIFFVAILVDMYFLLTNLTKWLDLSKREMALQEQLSSPQDRDKIVEK